MTDVEAKAIAYRMLGTMADNVKYEGSDYSDEELQLISSHIKRECERMAKMAKLLEHHADKFKNGND